MRPPASTASDPAGPAIADGPSGTHAASGDAGSGEVIEVTGLTPAAPGSIALDAEVARQTAGALGEPFRALSLLPGVTTSIAASGYPVIRGTLPGESRYEFDGIELPMLYHYLIVSQVIHPVFIGDLALRAGGQGAEEGHLIGGLVAMTPSHIAGPGPSCTPIRSRSARFMCSRCRRRRIGRSIGLPGVQDPAIRMRSPTR